MKILKRPNLISVTPRSVSVWREKHHENYQSVQLRLHTGRSGKHTKMLQTLVTYLLSSRQTCVTRISSSSQICVTCSILNSGATAHTASFITSFFLP